MQHVTCDSLCALAATKKSASTGHRRFLSLDRMVTSGGSKQDVASGGHILTASWAVEHGGRLGKARFSPESSWLKLEKTQIGCLSWPSGRDTLHCART